MEGKTGVWIEARVRGREDRCGKGKVRCVIGKEGMEKGNIDT